MNVIDYFFEKSKNLNKDVIFGRQGEISYKEIYSQIHKLSCYLNSLGYSGERIGVLAENSIFFVVAYLGVMKSGNVVVPLPIKIEESELDRVIGLCDMKLFFVQEKFENILTKETVKLITEKGLREIFTENYNSVEKETDDDEIAAIIFTSGSTGESKGVMLSHGNIVANTNSIIKYLKITESDIQLVVLPFYYCFGASLLHTHLRQGGSVVLNNTFIFTKTVLGDIIKYKCTCFSGVPSNYQILLRKSKFKEIKFPSLRYLTQAGGKLADPFIKEIRESHPEIEFIIMYGQTEATARLSYLPFEKLKDKFGSIGKGIPGVKLEVIDKEGVLVKPNIVGEVVATGNNIMKGYFKDPEETQKVLKNGKLHTGDLAVTDEEGYIFIHSRKKHLIKSAGNRISPKEIESVICELPEVVSCVVIGAFDELLSEVPKAIIVLNKKGIKTEEEIRNYCRKKLAIYKVPKYIVFINKMPLNSSGKIDVKKLNEEYKNVR